METGKPGLASAPVQSSSDAARTEKKMDIQAPLTAFYIRTVPALPAQPYIQPPAAAREPATLHLPIPPLYSKETLPFLTLHIAGGLQCYPQELSLATAAPAARSKLTGKHVCPHCGRDCMKPSVLEKHLRCHTGERPYPCATCGVSFKTQSNLYKHKRTQAHARLSSESEQSSLGSQDSTSSSKEICGSSLSLDRSEESGSLEKNATAAAELASPTSIAKVSSVKKPPAGDADNEQNKLLPASQTADANESLEFTKEKENQQKPPLTVNRHLPLQRQEATLFSKQWENSVSRGKSQSHESTDSGFSESSDHYPSPSSLLPEHSMDSLTESVTEHLEEPSGSCRPLEAVPRGQEPKEAVSEQEQKKLEEHISKLISENTAVVEDKQLENVRPRKTVLSKQGSIDLPMPYTYKDSFHFDMRISKAANVGLQRNRKPELYSSVPAQYSMEHTPLTRSNSLPFSVTLLQPERNSPPSSYQSDYVTLVRRGSSGHINPTSFAIKPVNQQISTHRPLVRQTAVDCNHATDGLFRNSSVEEACTSTFNCSVDGSDMCGEPNRKFRRKKTQKFAYNKWYMYGGGTFKKLYNTEKGGNNNVTKGRKSLTNPEHEGPGIQKRSSAVHKDIVTTINSTSSSATVLPQPSYAPINQPTLSTMDFHPNVMLHSAHGVKTPLRRNLSLSTLQLPSAGSPVTSNTLSISRPEGDAATDTEKHTDSFSKLCGAHIPSERKKQRTDDKIVCPVEMETDSNMPTQTTSSISVPPQDTSLTSINLPTNPKHIQLFPPCIIRAKGASTCTSIPSFLPKYQLKLPNATEQHSRTSQPAAPDELSFTCQPSSSHADKTSTSIKPAPLTKPLVQTHNIKKANSFHSTRGQPVFTLTATTTLSQNDSSHLPVLCRQFATTSATTTCVRDDNGSLCTTSIQVSTSKPAVSSGPMQIPRPTPSVVQNGPTTNILSTESSQLAASSSAFSRGHHPSPISSSPSPSTNPVNTANSSSNDPIAPCQTAPFDLMQPAVQNVFHVHTADLQICLQIISDEQLALIEPQIERQVNIVGAIRSLKNDVKAADTDVIQSKTQSSLPVQSTNECRDHEKPGHQMETDQRDSSQLNRESIKPLSEHFQKAEPNTFTAKHGNSSQLDLRISVESGPSKASGVSLHKHSHVTAVTETVRSTGHAMSTAALLKGVKSELDQTLSLHHGAEEKLLPDVSIGQGGLLSKTPSDRHECDPTSSSLLSHGAANLQKESQEKLQHQVASCAMKTSCERRGGQAGVGPASGSDELAATVSSFAIRNCNASRETAPHTSSNSSDPVESRLVKSDILHSSKHTDRDNSAPSQDATLHQSQDRISSTHSDKQPAPFTSSSHCILVEKPNDVTAELTTIQSPTAGLLEGSSLKQPEARDQDGTAGQPDSMVQGPKQSQEAAEMDRRCTEEQEDGGVLGEDNGGTRSMESDETAGQQEKPESNCKYRDTTKPEGEERTVKADSYKTSENLQHLSHSGMSESPPQTPQRSLRASHDLNSPASSHVGLFCSPQHEMEMNNFYFSQHHWEIGFTHNQLTQMSYETHSSQQVHAAETQSAFSHIQPDLQQSQQHIPHETPRHEQQQSTAGNVAMTAGLSQKSLSGNRRGASLSSARKTSSYPHGGHVSPSAEVSKAAGRATGDAQASNKMPCTSTNPEPDGQQDSKDQVTHAHITQSGNAVKADITNKCQPLFLGGQLHGYQPAECLRPVLYTDDTSSSDDEGKLIIEL